MSPDPANLGSFNHTFAKLSTGKTYHYIDEIPVNYNVDKTVTLLLIHGFPDLWASWKYQVGPWVGAGYRVVVPDMLGYGQTEKPDDPEEYSTKKLADDLVALLDHIGSLKAVVIGHDWGSAVVARFVQWHPQRVLGVVHLSIPFIPPSPEYHSLEDLVKQVPAYSYQLYFADPATDKKIENHIEIFYRIIFSAPDGTTRDFTDFARILNGEIEVDPSVIKTTLTDEELKYYVTQNSSFRGPLNYYRTTKVRFEEEKAGNLPMTYTVNIPVLFLRGAADVTSPVEWMDRMKKLLPQTRVVNYKDAGHWLTYERKDEVAKDVLDWLADSNLNLS